MANVNYEYSTNRLTKDQIGDAVDYMMGKAQDQRRSFERRWYDNNFFDDGHHFRYLSRSQNKIVDLSEYSTLWSPMRAIPKASRQVRGVSNLLSSRKYLPIVYPEKVTSSQFPPLKQYDPATGQTISQPNPEYPKALEEAKRIAGSSGHWLEEEFKKQELTEKIALMIILAAKHGVSYLQVWPDAIDEEIKTQVYDAFDIYLMGSLQEVEDSPFVIKTKQRFISEIKADERFDPEQLLKINPDNRHASSDIKEAYAKARFGGIGSADQAATLIEKEAFIKEYLDDENMPRVRMSKNGEQILKGKKKGDPVIRHTFVGGNVTLKDEYVNLPGYPIVDFRFEPGPIYQVPLIERFIPANKSLDLVVSRVERFTHTMVAGSWSIKAGESAEPNNTAGGQIFNYNTTPPIQNPIATIPAFVFQFMGLLQSLIEEQGVTTSALGKLPPGVKANAAIESLKESEFANLAISDERLKGTVRRIAEKMFDHADNYFIRPKTIYYLEKGEPQYFDIIGNTALEKRKELKIDEEPLNAIPIKKDYRVDIEVEAGLGYTREGQKQAAKELGDYLIQMSQLGLVSPEVVKEYFGRLLEIYKFGASKEIMEAMDTAGQTEKLSEDQITKIKVAVLEALKDAGEIGEKASDNRILENKVGLMEALEESGLADHMGGEQPTNEKEQAEIEAIKQDMRIKEAEHELKLAQETQKMEVQQAQVELDMEIKKAESDSNIEIKKETSEHAMDIKEKSLEIEKNKPELTKPKN